MLGVRANVPARPRLLGSCRVIGRKRLHAGRDGGPCGSTDRSERSQFSSPRDGACYNEPRRGLEHQSNVSETRLTDFLCHWEFA
jgi:hypothetical protein